jgi:hypothetical protein
VARRHASALCAVSLLAVPAVQGRSQLPPNHSHAVACAVFRACPAPLRTARARRAHHHQLCAVHTHRRLYAYTPGKP